jgi:SIR2-like domain
MFSRDTQTFVALNALKTSATERPRPLVVWIGAGASVWAGYPLWKSLASGMHSQFSREVAAYERDAASAALQQEQYPELFEFMRISDEQAYLNMLVSAFSPREVTPVYSRFLGALKGIKPTFVLTTNVDDMLERNLSALETVQRSDVERIPTLITQGTGFVGKMHGSVSSAKSMVFSKSDYDDIALNDSLLTALSRVLSTSTVLFLGYGLRDAHIISTLQRTAKTLPLFGMGPHFIVTPQGSNTELPTSVRRIQYVTEPADHRSALLALELVADSPSKLSAALPSDTSPPMRPRDSESIYFISDLVPPGTVTTSQTLTIEGHSDSRKREMIVGDGYVDGEVDLHDYSALHDVVVGLICFDRLCVSLDHLGILHQLLTAPIFWSVAATKALQLFIPPRETAVIFPDSRAPVGDLGVIHIGSVSSSFEDFTGIKAAELIRRQIKPAPGHEAMAERQLEQLERSLIDLSDQSPANSLADMTRGALMHPSIRGLLGVSAGTPRSAVPRWVAFPILRLANVMRKGVICEHLGVRATRMIWGSERLATAVFAAAAGVAWADDAASYVLAGRFNSDLGALIRRQPELLVGVLRFRESPAGQSLRREISERLALNEGGQIVTALNSGLREAIPVAVLQQARDQLSGLFMPRESDTPLVPAVWGDLRNADARIARWRSRSRALLDEYCRTNRVGGYDACPCGSGDKLRFCCVAALS